MKKSTKILNYILVAIILLLIFTACSSNVQPGFKDVGKAAASVVVDDVIDTTAHDLQVVAVDTVYTKVDNRKVDVPVVIAVEKVIDYPKLISEAYTAEIGVKELTGKNDGARVEAYLKTVGLGKGFAWCAAFVKYCLLKAGVREATRINGMALSVHDPSRFVYFKGKYYAELKRSDVFTLYYTSLGRIGHTGFYDGWANKSMGTYFSVEGNTNGGGSRDGDGVYRRVRQIGGTYSINRWTR